MNKKENSKQDNWMCGWWVKVMVFMSLWMINKLRFIGVEAAEKLVLYAAPLTYGTPDWEFYMDETYLLQSEDGSKLKEKIHFSWNSIFWCWPLHCFYMIKKL